MIQHSFRTTYYGLGILLVIASAVGVILLFPDLIPSFRTSTSADRCDYKQATSWDGCSFSFSLPTTGTSETLTVYYNTGAPAIEYLNQAEYPLPSFVPNIVMFTGKIDHRTESFPQGEEVREAIVQFAWALSKTEDEGVVLLPTYVTMDRHGNIYYEQFVITPRMTPADFMRWSRNF